MVIVGFDTMTNDHNERIKLYFLMSISKKYKLSFNFPALISYLPQISYNGLLILWAILMRDIS